MKTRTQLLLALLSLSIPAGQAPPGGSGRVEQRVLHSAGFVEPHAPGSGVGTGLVAPRLSAPLTPEPRSFASAEPTEAVPLIVDFEERVRRIRPSRR